MSFVGILPLVATQGSFRFLNGGRSKIQAIQHSKLCGTKTFGGEDP